MAEKTRLCDYVDRYIPLQHGSSHSSTLKANQVNRLHQATTITQIRAILGVFRVLGDVCPG